ncbi:MAG: MFS transporter [archaeon YNP-LCB-003-016]|nr:MFS transporter [Candidatus Culexarchaeum yellowstonense]
MKLLMLSSVRSLMTIYVGVLVIALGVGVVTPAIPLYARSLGASYVEVGLLGTFYSLTYIVLAVLSGWLSDHVGRKVVITGSAVLCGFAAFLYLISSSVISLFLARVVEGGAWCSFWSALEALVTELAWGRAGGAMGVCGMFYGVGYLIGSVLGGFLVSSYGFKATFLLYFCLSFMATVIFANVKARGMRSYAGVRELYGVEVLGGRHGAIALLTSYVLSFCLSILWIVMITLFPVYVEDLRVNAFWIGVLFGAFWLGHIVFFVFAGRLSDTFGRENVLIPSMACLSIASMLIVASSDFTILFIVNLIIGCGLGSAYPVAVALISDVTPSQRRGVMMGLFESLWGIGMLVGSTLGGWIAEFNVRGPYILCGVLCAVCTLTVVAYKLRTKSSTVQPS